VLTLLDYTTYADIRGALGISVKELADATLALRLYEDALHADLEDVALAVPTTFETVVDVAVPSAEQERFLQSTRLFAIYSVAKHLTVSLPLFSPVKVADGKAEMGRATDPHRETVKRVHQEYERWRNRLIKAFEALGEATAASTPRPYFAIITPTPDPVTGV
jgi:hypothetical protein